MLVFVCAFGLGMLGMAAVPKKLTAGCVQKVTVAYMSIVLVVKLEIG